MEMQVISCVKVASLNFRHPEAYRSLEFIRREKDLENDFPVDSPFLL